jgi:hypothetical protein
MKSIITYVLLLAISSFSYDKIPYIYKMKHVRWNTHLNNDICYHMEKDGESTICWLDSNKVKFPDKEISYVKLQYTSFGLQRIEIISIDYTNDPYAILGISKYDSCVNLLGTLYKASQLSNVGTGSEHSDDATIYKTLLNHPEWKKCTLWENNNHNISVCLAPANINAGRLITTLKGPYWHD